MTTKDAILGLAAKISESAVSNVATDAQALAELAKAMCGSAPTEPIATVDDAIAYITANYSGGGGGGVDVGALTRVSEETSAQPAVGNWGEFGTVIATIKVGSATITDSGESADMSNAAAGTTVFTDVTPAESADTADAYVCTLEGNWTNGWQYKAVTPWDGTVTRDEVEYQGETAYRWTFTVPELQEGQWLIIWKHIAE